MNQEIDIEFLKDMTVLKIEPSDLIVFMTEHRIPNEMRVMIKTWAETRLKESGLNNKIMVLEGGMQIGVVRGASA